MVGTTLSLSLIKKQLFNSTLISITKIIHLGLFLGAQLGFNSLQKTPDDASELEKYFSHEEAWNAINVLGKG